MYKPELIFDIRYRHAGIFIKYYPIDKEEILL
jgi:hypothetical protein